MKKFQPANKYKSLIFGDLRKNAGKENLSDTELNKILEDAYMESIPELARILKEELDERSNSRLAEDGENSEGFRDRLYSIWKTPVDRLSIIIVCSRELGAEFNYWVRKSGALTPKTDVQTRLHARSVYLASQIVYLVRGGFADGALASWRSLHETCVILKLISGEDEELASRFLAHEVIGTKNAADAYRKHSEKLNLEPFSDENYKEITDLFKKAEADYGKKFIGEDYGWTSGLKGNNVLKFRELEEYVELNYLRPFYKLASDGTHAGVASIGYKLGLSLTNEDILLSGPSNEGMTDPLQLCALSLCICNSSISDGYVDSDWHIFSEAIWRMFESLKDEAGTAHHLLAKKGQDCKK
jgi:hypothetical protein